MVSLLALKACHLFELYFSTARGWNGGSRVARISHLSDDETVAKMGHPVCAALL